MPDNGFAASGMTSEYLWDRSGCDRFVTKYLTLTLSYTILN